MGVDIYSEQGFLLEFSKFVALFRQEHLEEIQKNVIPCFRESVNHCFEIIRDEFDAEFVVEVRTTADRYVRHIETAETI